MPSAEGFPPANYGELADEALRTGAWNFPESDADPSLAEAISPQERIAQVAFVMQKTGDLLGKIPYVNSKVERENGLDRFAIRHRIREIPGPHPSIPFVSFSYYRHSDFNTLDGEQLVVTPFRLVVASRLPEDEEIAATTAIYEKTGKIPEEPVGHRFTFFFSRNGEGHITVTPAQTPEDVRNDRVLPPQDFSVTDDAIRIARDSMWQLYKKADILFQTTQIVKKS